MERKSNSVSQILWQGLAFIPITALSCAILYYLPTSEDSIFFCITCQFFCIIAFILIIIFNKLYSKHTLFLCTAILLGLCIAFSIKIKIQQDESSINFGTKMNNIKSFSGVVIEDSRISAKGNTIINIHVTNIESENIKAQSNFFVTVILSGFSDYIFTGQKVNVNSPIITTKEQLFFSYPNKDKIVIDIDKENFLLVLRKFLLSSLLSKIDKIDSPAGGFFKALFLGLKDDLSQEDALLFKNSGCLHVLALSGQHLSILASLIMLLATPFFGRKIAFVLGCVVILFYVFIVGTQPSILRAAVMYFLFAVTYLLNRQSKPLNVLAFAFLILILLNPSSGKLLSFQLSFLAIGGLIIGSRIPDLFLSKYLPKYFSSAVGASIGAQVTTGPIMIFVFNAWYPGSIIATVLSGFIMTIFIWTGMVTTLLMCFPLPFNPALILLNIEYEIFIKTIQVGTLIPPVIFDEIITKISGICIIIFFLIVFYGIPYMRLARRKFQWIDQTMIHPKV